MNNLYTPNKVFLPLAQLLPDGCPLIVDITRFSIVGDRAGIAAQRGVHSSIYGSDPAIQTIGTWPDEAWDPQHPDVGAKYGVRWIRMQDLHHSAAGTEPIAAVALVGDHLIVSITLSSTTRHIVREDGEDENGYTRLMLAILNHYRSLTKVRWADDVTRAGRDAADWAQLKAKAKVRDVRLVLGGREYDLKNSGDELALGALGLVASNDDPLRRHKLTGKRLLKYRTGGAALSERQMPHGWRLQRDRHGRPVREGDKGLLPEGQPERVEALACLYRMAAEGAPWHALGAQLIELEQRGKIERRSHIDPGATYAAMAGNPQATYDAAKNIFVRSNFVPATAPATEDIDRYEAGEDPRDLFDADTLQFLAKVELIRTGQYHRRLKNDIRGRGLVLDGVPASYADDADEYGHFDVLSAPWPWPVDPRTGVPIIRFGITDEQCRKVGARLLRELRSPSRPTGGRAHLDGQRRVLQRFENWTLPSDHPDARYADEATEFGVEARQNNSGRENFIILFRRESVGQCKGQTNWHWVGAGERRPDHIAGTGNLAELTASVAVALDSAVEAALDPKRLATAQLVVAASASVDRRPALRARVARAEQTASAAADDAAALRIQAGRRAAAGDLAGADRYDALAEDQDRAAASARSEAAGLLEEIDGLQEAAAAATKDPVDANVTVAAYLVVGLERAARSNGRAARELGRLADKVFRDWTFTVRGDEIHWHACAALPLRDGGDAVVPLSGVIRNVRSRAGKALATPDIVARYVFQEGRSLDDVAHVLEVSRKRLLTGRVMPWMVGHGVTSRGAKNALVDHPVQAVRQVVHTVITADADAIAALPWPRNWVDLVAATYLDPTLRWGDAACPDDVRWVQQLVATLNRAGGQVRSVSVLDAALAMGVSEDAIRALARPVQRSEGFSRPQYLRYLPGSHKARVQLIPCPHGCRRASAAAVVLLPEVAASGFGVLCTTCRRAPSSEAGWAQVAFPASYLEPVTGTGRGGSLREEAQTRAVPCAIPLNITSDGA